MFFCFFILWDSCSVFSFILNVERSEVLREVEKKKTVIATTLVSEQSISAITFKKSPLSLKLQLSSELFVFMLASCNLVCSFHLVFVRHIVYATAEVPKSAPSLL